MVGSVGILGLQGAVHEHQQALAALGVDSFPIRTQTELAAADGLIVPGGESSTIWRLATQLSIFTAIADRIASGLPTLGTCAGLVMLSDRITAGLPDQQPFGGLAITTRRNAFGRQIESFETPLKIAGLTGSFPGVFIRAPWVESADPEVSVLATVSTEVDGGRVEHPVAVQQGTVLATAFHPELTDDLRIHEMFLQMVAEKGS